MDYDKVILHGKFILDSLFYNMSKFTLNVEEKVVETYNGNFSVNTTINYLQ